VVRILTGALVAGVLIAALGMRTSYAATSTLLHKDSCQPDGKVQTTFSWQGNDPAALQQWIDLSTSDNGWQAGTFISAGPFAGSATSFNWNGLLANTGHYVRVNQQLAGGTWDPSTTFSFQTPPCATSQVSTQTGGSTGSGTSSTSSTKAAPGQDCFYRGGLADALCTPGVIDKSVTQDNIQTTICTASYLDSVAPPASFVTPLMQKQMVLYGVGNLSMNDFEENHLIPIALGGAPQDPRNMFPEPLKGQQNANDKHVVENALHRAVCKGSVALQLAQRYIAGDWTTALGILGVTPTPADFGTTPSTSGSSTPSGSSTSLSVTSSQQQTTALPSPTPASTTQQPQTQLPPPPPPPPPPASNTTPY